VLIGLVAALAVEGGLLLPFPLALVLQAASERTSKKSRLRALNQFFRCKKKLFIEFSSLIGFREFLESLKNDKEMLIRFCFIGRSEPLLTVYRTEGEGASVK